MSHLLNEVGLRLIKAGLTFLLALILYGVLSGPVGHPGSVELALLCWLSAAAFILIVESGMF